MKKIDEELGGTTPLNIILKFPKSLKKENEEDEFDEWEEENKIMKIKQNIGLQEINDKIIKA